MAGDQVHVLSALDGAKTQWYHFTAIIVAGMGFFTDAYDLFCISLVTKLIGRIYYTVPGSSRPGSLPPTVSAVVNGVAFVGTLSGQLFFGWLGDKVGRKSVYGMTLMLMILCSVASGLSFGNTPTSVMATLCFFRFWLRFMPETARYTALIAKNAERAAADMSKVLQVEITKEQAGDLETVITIKSHTPPPSFGLFSGEFVRRHGLHLVGTASTWLLLDIAYYSQNLFQKDIFSAIGWIPPAPTMSALDELFHIARAQILIALCGTVPGYWFTVAFIDSVGRFKIQLMGFFMMTTFMVGLAVPYDYWTGQGHQAGFVVMYALTFFFANFGPNATTFIVPAEIYPARLRATCHGISAASGKVGAIIGSFGFLYLAQSPDPAKTAHGYHPGIGVRYSLLVLAGCSLMGFLLTFLVPEPKGKSLEEMSRETEPDHC
uniref:H(+)/Pi cotransporter n=1 Tax=Aegilops tauschii TaxID=37682 RepID=N1R3J2_AEGTA